MFLQVAKQNFCNLLATFVFCVGIILVFTVGHFHHTSPHNNHTIAAQAVRRSVLATTTALPTTLATVTATAFILLEPADECSFAPNCVPTTTSPSDTLATATAPQLPEVAVASLDGPHCGWLGNSLTRRGSCVPT
jgi:hypothetical protein